jgi:hypothetical protein
MKVVNLQLIPRGFSVHVQTKVLRRLERAAMIDTHPVVLWVSSYS